MKILDLFKRKANAKRTTRVGCGTTVVHDGPCVVHAITANSTNNTSSVLLDGDEEKFSRLFQGQTPMFDAPFATGLTVRGGEARHDLVITWTPA